jgi:hypothetical protein
MRPKKFILASRTSEDSICRVAYESAESTTLITPLMSDNKGNLKARASSGRHSDLGAYATRLRPESREEVVAPALIGQIGC